MRSVFLTFVLRAALYVALVASAALFADYQQEAGPGFCGVVSGCAEVRASAYSTVAGVPLPTVGLGTFLGLFALAAWTRTRRQARILALMSSAVALGAIALIAIMVFVLDAVCQWCMAVDVGAIVAAGCALLLMRREPFREVVGARILWTAAGVVAVALTLVWGQGPRYQPPPPDVAKLHVPGRVTMVVFTDFQCPFCRLVHPVIRELEEQHPEELEVRLVLVPLPNHPGADVAARGYVCAAPEHRRKVADALYEFDVDPLVYQVVEDAAAEAGVDVATYAQRLNEEAEQRRFGKLLYTFIEEEVRRSVVAAGGDAAKTTACLRNSDSANEIEQNAQMFGRTGLSGLPSIYVGNFLVQGADETLLRAAVSAALAGSRGRDARLMFFLLGALLVGVSAVSALRARRSRRTAVSR